MEKEVEEQIKNKGILGVEVSISADIFSSPMVVENIYVDIYNAVLSSENKNINIAQEVTKAVKSVIDISEERVIVYE